MHFHIEWFWSTSNSKHGLFGQKKLLVWGVLASQNKGFSHSLNTEGAILDFSPPPHPLHPWLRLWTASSLVIGQRLTASASSWGRLLVALLQWHVLKKKLKKKSTEASLWQSARLVTQKVEQNLNNSFHRRNTKKEMIIHAQVVTFRIWRVECQWRKKNTFKSWKAFFLNCNPLKQASLLAVVQS